MKNILLKLICFLALSLGAPTVSKAQLVHIPDPAFRNYLNLYFSSCMVGDSIDSSCPAVLAAKNIDVSSKGISNLSGIEVFVNDTFLLCSYNQLIALPTLPAKLTNLHCNNNFLTTLPTLPSSLTMLSCERNQITSLPTLPTSLINLLCTSNQISTLPSLPNSLDRISCGRNLLASLPVLPASLTRLNCGGNYIISLPILPSSLKYLYCDDNQLTSLPNLSNSMIDLVCDENQISFISALPDSLKNFHCHQNQLSSLPNLPSALTNLICEYNQLSSLPTLPTSLIRLLCNQNQLTSLPVLPNSLIEIYCSQNQLTSLPELPDSLNKLGCDDNPLHCLPELKRITFLTFLNTQINCLPGYGMLQNTTPTFIGFPICGIYNSNGCDVYSNIDGSTFLDVDTNCHFGSNESYLKNQKINLYKNGVLHQQTFSASNGDYSFDTFSFDLYKTEYDTTVSLFETYCPSSGFFIDSISMADSLKYNRDFGLKCKDVDIAVTSIISNNLRPASIREIKILAGDVSQYFGANCAAGIIGTVLITISGPCNYYSPAVGALTPSSINGNVLTYSIADFGVLSYDSSFNFNILVDTTASLGSQICIQVSISTRSQELNYNNNLLSQCFTVVGSYDPNDKSVFPISSLDISGDRWLTYLIRFQNTGTASAEHIYITDTLSALLDWSTFNLLSYSHMPIMQVYNDGLVKFNFPHINLPDSNSNEPASHGFVQYKIRAKDSLAIGSTVENTANIFFDFNPPIITNTTNNTVINCSIPPTIINAIVCNSLNFELNGIIYSNSGTHVQRFITAYGCDSTIHLNLTINSTKSYLTEFICDGDMYNFNGQQLASTGIYVDTLTNIIGCDSIIHLNLQVKTTHYSIHQVTICDNESYLFDGIYLTQAGTYLNTLMNISNCDSIIELNLMVEPGIVNILSQESFMLQTTAIGSAYQWINCATNNNIAGATNSTFHPILSGDYAVEVTYGNCVDTSDCRTIKLISGDVILQTWYNSTSNQIKLKAENLRGNMGVVRLIDISGRIILEKKLDGISSGILNTEISTNGISEGIYIVNLITDRESDSGKVVKY